MVVKLEMCAHLCIEMKTSDDETLVLELLKNICEKSEVSVKKECCNSHFEFIIDDYEEKWTTNILRLADKHGKYKFTVTKDYTEKIQQ